MSRFAQLLVGFLAVFSFATAGATDLVEGKNYARLKVPQPVESR